MGAPAVHVDAGVEAHIGTLVVRDDAARVIAKIFRRGMRRFLFGLGIGLDELGVVIVGEALEASRGIVCGAVAFAGSRHGVFTPRNVVYRFLRRHHVTDQRSCLLYTYT